jgi:hypothetical protein
MDFDLRQAIESLDPEQVFEIANQARPPARYLFNSILPNRNMETYDIEGGSMTIRTTMAGLSGMDSEYTEGGAADSAEFAGQTGKMTIHSALTEKMLRSLQAALLRLAARRMDNTGLIQQTGLNWVNKIIVQALLDREEWLKGQALSTGKLDWTFNGKRLRADYGIPAENILPARTGTDAYGSTTSKFWEDIHALYDLLNWDVRAFLIHPTLLRDILNNQEYLKLEQVNWDAATGSFSLRRLTERFGNTQQSPDSRDRVTLIAYKEEGEIFDLDNPGKTKKIPFMPIGPIIAIGAPIANNVFEIGEGSTPAPASPVQLGYTHIAPTTEGGGRPGRWTRLYVPEERPWSMESDGVENVLPIIEAPERIAISFSDIL